MCEVQLAIKTRIAIFEVGASRCWEQHWEHRCIQRTGVYNAPSCVGSCPFHTPCQTSMSRPHAPCKERIVWRGVNAFVVKVLLL